MKTAILTAALVALTIATTPAQAAHATLVSCTQGQSVTGLWGYVGTYQVFGPMGPQQFQRFTSSYCPYSIEVQ
jgi:hypothetical protein